MKIFLFLFLAFAPIFCLANPTYDVTRGALQNSSALCGYGHNPSCSSESGGGRHIVKNVTVNLPSKYGAIAQSLTTNAISSAVNEDSPEEAIRMAVANCESVKGNGKCQSRTWVRNACLSMAEGKSGKYYKAFIASSGKRNQAEPLALKKCTQSGAKDCKILMPEECSLPEIPR